MIAEIRALMEENTYLKNTIFTDSTPTENLRRRFRSPENQRIHNEEITAQQSTRYKENPKQLRKETDLRFQKREETIAFNRS